MRSRFQPYPNYQPKNIIHTIEDVAVEILAEAS